MHARRLVLSLGLFAITLGARGVAAQASATVCKDGSSSAASGKGACSSHGGVDAKATTAAKKAAAAAAKPAPVTVAQVTCTDGTMSKPGRGACSRHGGVKGSSPAQVPAATAASTPASPPARTQATPAPKVASAPSSRRGEDKDPTDAIAQCKDGMYSHAANHRGACSKHGGVAKFLKP